MREANRKSFKAARDALGLAKRNDNKELMGTSLVQVTRCHLTNGRLDKAFKSSEEAIELLHEVNDRSSEAFAMALNAEALLGKKDKEQAAKVAERAVWLARSARDAAAENYAVAVFNAVFADDIKAVEAAAALPQAADTQSLAALGDSAGPVVVEKKPTLVFEDVRAIILKNAMETVGETDELYSDSSLMDAGMDSLSAVAFRNQLQRELAGINLPASLMFDYPTINQISDFVVEESVNKK